MPEELSLGQLLRKYIEVEMACRESLGPLQTQLEELTAQIKAIREPYEIEQMKLFGRIKPLAEAELKDAEKKSREFPGGKLKYRSGYLRHSWNTDKLLGYAQAHPEILAFDSPRKVDPVVSIELD